MCGKGFGVFISVWIVPRAVPAGPGEIPKWSAVSDQVMVRGQRDDRATRGRVEVVETLCVQVEAVATRACKSVKMHGAVRFK